MLTPCQRDCLTVIAERLSRDGVSPSFREIMRALGLNSTCGVQRMLNALEERGMIRRLKDRSRAIEVLPAGWASARRATYFRFDDESKTFVPWRAPAARKTA